MKKTIRSQIMLGYLLIATVPVIITLVTIISLFQINAEVEGLSRNRANQNATKDAVVGHYSWLMGLGDTIKEGKEFTGSLDPTTCGFGKWMATASPEDLKDPTIAQALDRLMESHNEIHTEATRLINLSKTDQAAAYKEYTEQIEPKVADIITEITVITNQYGEFAEQFAAQLTSNIIRLMIYCIVLVIAGVLAAVVFGRIISKRISKPIEIIADLSRQLAVGHDDLNFAEMDSLKLDEDNEAKAMIVAFEQMAKSIQNNVSVVKRVAAGDLTAYVDVRSADDNLGQNLYHMVQSNDIMFGQILQIASDVASNANQIATASSFLADSATKQAGSTEELSAAMKEMNELTFQNKQKVAETIEVFDDIRTDVGKSGEKMEQLVEAVDEIRMASDKISAVIKSIEDLAFQTDILAINAAVEAARAGEAGKGFAVVADEVRNLANKSGAAADQTKVLIENTISKSYKGSAMAKETGETFANINQNLERSAKTVKSIEIASEAQVKKIKMVKESISMLLDLSTMNAASSEQASASSAEMHSNAGKLREEMKKFNLRQRTYGKAYIPPEKEKDLEFIRIANENYQKALEQGIVKV